MTPEEQALALARWQGQVDSQMSSFAASLERVEGSVGRVESKVNSIKNENSESRGSFRVGVWIGGVASSGVLIVFAAFVTKVFG